MRTETVIVPTHSDGLSRFQMPTDGVWFMLTGIRQRHSLTGIRQRHSYGESIDHTDAVAGRRVMNGTMVIGRCTKLQTITQTGVSEYWVDLADGEYDAWSLTFHVPEASPPWKIDIERGYKLPNVLHAGPRITRPEAKWNF